MRYSVAIAALALSSLSLAGCAGAPSLESELRDELRQADSETFRLSSLDAVNGDTFLVVCPYESPESVESRLGFSWSQAPDYSLDDTRQTLAVFSGEDVVSRAEFDRDQFDFCADGNWQLTQTTEPLGLESDGGRVLVSVP